MDFKVFNDFRHVHKVTAYFSTSSTADSKFVCGPKDHGDLFRQIFLPNFPPTAYFSTCLKKLRPFGQQIWPIGQFTIILSGLLVAHSSPVKRLNFYNMFFAANCYPVKNHEKCTYGKFCKKSMKSSRTNRIFKQLFL